MENNAELDIINHLLAIEKDASALINDAQIESEKRVAEAKVRYNTEYKEKYEKIVASLETDFQKQIENEKNAHNKEIKDYENLLESSEKNVEVFNEVLNKLLFT